MSDQNDKPIDTHTITPDVDESIPHDPHVVRRKEPGEGRKKPEPKKVGKEGPMGVGVPMDHSQGK